MDVKDLLRHNITFTHQITKKYLEDVADDELLERAVPGSNHLAWQLGHLIASERSLLSAVGFDVPDLPEGFEKNHGRDNIDSDDPSQFLSKGEYLTLMDSMHKAARDAIDKVNVNELDTPTPESMRTFFPTVGSVLLMAGSHEMMHAGQIATIRRKLGKPVVI